MPSTTKLPKNGLAIYDNLHMPNVNVLQSVDILRGLIADIWCLNLAFHVIYLNGKARVLHLEEFDLSAGILYTNITSADENGLTVIYANSTYGTRDAALTLTAGLSVSGTENSGQYPLFIIGGELKLSNSAKLLSENWILTSPESGKIFSLGVRFYGKKVAGDFGLMYFVDEDGESISGWPFVPWVGLSYNF